MKKVLILIVFIIFPLLVVGQTTGSDADKKQDVIQIETNIDVKSPETKIVLSASAKEELTNLSYKKSNDLISITAYKKSLQIKVKEIKIC